MKAASGLHIYGAVSWKQQIPPIPRRSHAAGNCVFSSVSDAQHGMLQAVAVTEAVTREPGGVRGCMSRVCNRERIVWAKLAGYRPWPARMITEDEREEPFFQQADGHKRPEDDTLVCFFGTNDLAWVVRKKAIKTWKGGLQHGFHNARKKDKTFHFALAQVQHYVWEKQDKVVRELQRECDLDDGAT